MAKLQGRKRKAPRRPVSAAKTKLQRWIDLLAALLSRSFPTPFDELRRDVPAYAATDRASLMRMFERDKDELRAFGVLIETVTFGDPPQTGYRLRRQDFYLPFLAVAGGGRAPTRTAVPPDGYRALGRLSFEPDELAVVAAAAARVRTLGDPLLSADVDDAMRKLAFDLPPDALRPDSDEHVLAETVDEKTFAVLGRAVLDRKFVSFDYHAMSSDKTKLREVEPYGLAFLGAHWYLVARDREHGKLRNYRLSRMASVTPNRARAQSADYDIPATFSLESHARSRDAWHLGEDAIIEAVVEFRGSSGAVRQGMKLGDAVRGSPGQRRFQVRRPDTFARWILAFGGDAVPLEPPSLVERFRAIARDTLQLYGDAQ